MIERFSRGQVATFRLDLISSGTTTTGASPVAAVKRLSDGKWFKASDNTWQVSPFDNPMTETSQTDLPGRYHFDFDQTQDAVEDSVDYIVRMKNSTTTLVYVDASFAPLSAATMPSLCAIQGSLVGLQGGPVRNALVRATLIPVALDPQNRGVETTRVVQTYSNDSGDFQISVVRGVTIRLEIDAIGYDRKLEVPDLASADFVNL